MKKIINWIFIISLCVASSFLFIGNTQAKALELPNYSNTIYETSGTFNNSNVSSGLITSYDYSIIDNIEVDSSFYTWDILTNSNISLNTGIIYSAGNYAMPTSMEYYYNYVSFICDDYSCSIDNYNDGGIDNIIEDGKTYYSSSINTNTNNKFTILFRTTNDKYRFNNDIISALNNNETFYEDNLTNTIDYIENEYTCFVLTFERTNNTTGTIVENRYDYNSCETKSNTMTIQYYIYGKLVGTKSYTYSIKYDSSKRACLAEDLDFTNAVYTLQLETLSNEEKISIFNNLTQFQNSNALPILELQYNFQNTNGSILPNDIFNNIYESGFNIFININFIRNNIYTFNKIIDYVAFKNLDDSNANYNLSSIYYDDDNVYNYSNSNIKEFDNEISNDENPSYSSALYNENITFNNDYLGKQIIWNRATTNNPKWYWSFNLLYETDIFITQNNGKGDYVKCKFYDLPCQAANVIEKVVFDIPILNSVYSMINTTITSIKSSFDIFKNYKSVIFIGTLATVSLGYHFIKRMVF